MSRMSTLLFRHDVDNSTLRTSGELRDLAGDAIFGSMSWLAMYRLLAHKSC